MKCEVLQDIVLKALKGSVVEVDERQFELARRFLKPVEIKKEVSAKTIETADAPKKRTAKKK